MPEDAVMDTAVDTELDTGLDTGAEPSAEPEISEPAAVGEPGKALEGAPKALIDGGKLSADAKKYLDELKTTNPTLARGIQRALFKEAELQRELPGGLKEVRELRQTIETLGGPNGVQEIQQEVQGWHQFDEQYMAGDPKAVEFMTSEPEGQEAFLKLIPSAIQKYEQLHPEGYRNYMAQVFNATANQSDIPLTIMRLADLLGENPRAMEQLQRLDGFFKFIKGEASKQVESPKFEKKAPEGGSDLEQREAAFTRKEWKAETAAEQQKIALDEWNRAIAGRKLSDSQKAELSQMFELKLNAAIQQKHAATLERYFAAKDKAGFLRYASQISRTEVPRIMQSVFGLLPGKPGPAPRNGAAPPAIRNGAPAKGQPIAAGFKDIGKQPGTQDIDYKNPFNSIANFRKGQAILKDGRKVSWKPLTA